MHYRPLIQRTIILLFTTVLLVSCVACGSSSTSEGKENVVSQNQETSNYLTFDASDYGTVQTKNGLLSIKVPSTSVIEYDGDSEDNLFTVYNRDFILTGMSIQDSSANIDTNTLNFT